MCGGGGGGGGAGGKLSLLKSGAGKKNTFFSNEKEGKNESGGVVSPGRIPFHLNGGPVFFPAFGALRT